jgi:hypothetical protein
MSLLSAISNHEITKSVAVSKDSKDSRVKWWITNTLMVFKVASNNISLSSFRACELDSL